MVAASPEKEEGEARILRTICTDTGLCLLFFYRRTSPSDYEVMNGPYVKTAYLTPSGGFKNLSSSVYLNITDEILNGMHIYEVQEDDDTFRLIGYNGKILYEIWWFKSNNSAIVKEKNVAKISGTFSGLSQWPYMNKIQNYSIVGLERPRERTDFFQMIKFNFDSVEKIPIEITLEELNTNSPSYLFDGNDSIFVIDYHVDFNYGQIRIRRLFLNGTLENYFFLDCPTGSPRGESLFIGRDGNLYFGLKIYDSDWQNYSQENYSHFLSITNLISKQTLTYSFTSPDNSYDFDLIIDSTSNLHVILNTYSTTHYVNFSPDYTLNFKSILKFPETGRRYIPDESFSLFQNRYFLGGLYKENKDVGVFVMDAKTGELISVDTSLFPFINYPKEFFGYFELLPILPGLITLIFIKKRLGFR